MQLRSVRVCLTWAWTASVKKSFKIILRAKIMRIRSIRAWLRRRILHHEIIQNLGRSQQFSAHIRTGNASGSCASFADTSTGASLYLCQVASVSSRGIMLSRVIMWHHVSSDIIPSTGEHELLTNKNHDIKIAHRDIKIAMISLRIEG